MMCEKDYLHSGMESQFYSPEHHYVDPLPISQAEYEAATARFIESVCQHPALRAVYQMGSTSAPGISDIDLIVIVADSFRGHIGQALSQQAIDERDAYLFCHPPLHLTESLAKSARRFCNIGNPQLCWGDPVAMPLLDAEEAHQIDVLVAAETLPWAWAKVLDSIQGKKEVVHIRQVLIEFTYLDHTIQTCSRLFGESTREWEQFVAGANCLRREWFTLPKSRYTQMNALLSDAYLVVEDLLRRFAEFLTKAHLLWEVKASTGVYLGLLPYFLFTRDWAERQHQFNQDLRFISRLRHIVCCLPIELLALYSQYAVGNGDIHRFMRKKIFGACSYQLDGQLASILARRLDLTHRHLDFVRRTSITQTLPLPAYLGMQPVLSARDKLKEWLKQLVTYRRAQLLLRYP